MDRREQITIMIPTYNRKESLTKLLKCLKNQTCQEFQVVISDNCSSYNVKDVIREYINFFGDRVILQIRNVNVGSTVNINGVFTLPKTKWGWLLGDDDYPLENAVETIYSYLDNSIAALHFSLYDLGNYIQDYKDIHDLNHFIHLYWEMSNGSNEIVNLQGDLIFMSNKVYNLDIMRDYLFQQNTYGYTRVPQIVSILFMLNNKDAYFRIVNTNLVTVSDTSNQSWKMTNIALGMSTFSHIKFDIDLMEKKKLNLIIMFKFSHVLRYRLQGEITRYDIGLIYDGIYKRNLNFFEKSIFSILMRLNPNGYIAKKIVTYKNRHIRLPKSKA
ncbi:glycosyltransferase family 2 protein [Robinsoniella peoriensis]|uniref:glycosyltransferase family 2 protein n=1 Tax=Robinsoniella peoriensis TaxID=180332 RepID=UPI0005C7B073|nr:glycosyltransferase family 2 protein [Robinsoniella peoriensis]